MKDIKDLASSGVLFDGRYKLLRPLSSAGGTADVWLALDTNTIDEVFDEETDSLTSDEATGIKVAIKIYRPKNALDLGEQKFREEFKIVFNCHHSNLIQPINFSIFEGVPYLVLPFCSNGSSEVLESEKLDKDILWKYIKDVSAGLAYLHAFNPTIVHHDIKPANVLIDDNKNFAITDFGISSHRGLTRGDTDSSYSGTMAYMAPERFQDDYESSPESDIWSFGVTLYEILTGKMPFGEKGGLSQLENGDSYPPLPQSVPSDIRNLINDCLSQDISKRPSAAAIHKAAEARQYPVKHQSRYYLIGGLSALLIVIAFILVFSLRGKHDELPSSLTLPAMDASESFEKAMALISQPDKDKLEKGLAIMEELGTQNYVPALYELAFTYGWYSDSASVARKNLLGIERLPASANAIDEQWLPKSPNVNTKAIGLLTRIEELNDSAYPKLNAETLYRLACYYRNDKVLKIDIERTNDLLIRAREWALICDDKQLLRRIDNGLSQ